ncbi:MAG: hypothetical protein P8M80_14110, partial [Pirellulaceae bacterium]|nr:hypothetical protein [Pirellulaceae bacterium]
VTNLAGSQGFLDFEVTEGEGSIRRDGLNLAPPKNGSTLVIRLRHNHPTRLTILINEKKQGSVELPAIATWNEVALPTAGLGSARIHSLQIDFAAQAKTEIEIDRIESK